MRRKVKNMTIKRNLLILIFLLLLLPMLTALLVLTALFRKASEDGISQANRQMISVMASKLSTIEEVSNYATSFVITDSECLNALKTIYTSSDDYQVHLAKMALIGKMKNLEQTSLNSMGGSIAILTNSGELITSDALAKVPALYQQDEWYDKVLASSRVPYWDCNIATLFSKNSTDGIAMARTIDKYGNHVWGIVSVYLPNDIFWKNIKSNASLSGNIMILDQNGRTISTNITKGGPLPDQSILNGLNLTGLKADEIRSGPFSPGHYYLASRVGTNNQILLFIQQSNSAEDRQTKALLIAAIVIISVFSCVIAIWIADRISRPLRGLVSDIHHFGEGNLDTSASKYTFTEINELSASFNQASQKIVQLIDQVKQETQRRERAYYDALTAQIRPHFLVNTLNTIKWTAMLNGDKNTAEMLSQLGVLLTAVYDIGNETVTVEQEFSTLNAYVGIMQIRFGNTFRYSAVMQPGTENCEVPKFVLQPLVENAIIHGISDIQDGCIRVNSFISGDSLYLDVQDNGKGISEMARIRIKESARQGKHEKGKLAGIGLDNVDERIRLLFGQKYGLHIDDHCEEGCRVFLVFPIEKKEQT